MTNTFAHLIKNAFYSIIPQATDSEVGRFVIDLRKALLSAIATRKDLFRPGTAENTLSAELKQHLSPLLRKWPGGTKVVDFERSLELAASDTDSVLSKIFAIRVHGSIDQSALIGSEGVPTSCSSGLGGVSNRAGIDLVKPDLAVLDILKKHTPEILLEVKLDTPAKQFDWAYQEDLIKSVRYKLSLPSTKIFCLVIVLRSENISAEVYDFRRIRFDGGTMHVHVVAHSLLGFPRWIHFLNVFGSLEANLNIRLQKFKEKFSSTSLDARDVDGLDLGRSQPKPPTR